MDLLQRILYTALSAISIFYFVVKISLSHWKNRGILHEKPKFLWGNLKGVGRKRHVVTAVQEIYEKYKGKAPFIGFYVFLKPMVLVLDLEVIRRILDEDATYFAERGLYYNEVNDPLSANLMQLDGDECQRLRNKLKPSFEEQKTQLLFPAILQVAATFKHALDAKQSSAQILVINELVDCFNMDIISSLAFGLEGDSLQYKHTEFRLMTRSYFKNFSLLKAYLAFNFPNIARLLQYKSYDSDATTYFLRLVKDKMKERIWNQSESYNDFLTYFARLKHQCDRTEKLNSKQVAAQAFSFILAGLEPFNSTLAFCLYELALQPELQHKAHVEISTVLKQYNGKLSLDSLEDMRYLKQVLFETLRKHSPYPFLLRNTIKDYEIPDSVFMLKQNNRLIVPISSIHHDPKIYPQPNTFDPDRFQPAVVKERHPMSWLPFGSGPRKCIAQYFAQLQMLVGLVTLLRDYKFSPCAETCIPLQYDNSKFILSPKSDIKLRVERV